MTAPVIELRAAQAAAAEFALRGAISLRVAPGELVLVEAEQSPQACALVEMCAGLPRLRGGAALFLGQDWAHVDRRQAQLLRGRIGLATGEGGWLPHLSVAEGMLLARLHHRAAPEAALRRDAEALAMRFGLPGLPAQRPHELSGADLARCACARAFLGSPALVLLESPLDIELADALVDPLRAALAPALAAGAAAIWSTRSRRAWDDPAFPATQRLRVTGHGLEAMP